MAYPNDGDPVVERLLERLRADIAAIATPNYHHDVTEAYVFEGRSMSIGPHPLVAIIIPQTDTVTGFLSCNSTEHDLQVAVIGTIRLMPNSADWKTQGQWFNADVIRAVSQDIQLGGNAVYCEPQSQDLFDAGSNNIAVAQVTLRVNYRHVYDNPSLTA